MAEARPTDNFRYYAYMLCYVDDILCMHHDPMTILDRIDGYMPLKPYSVGDPDIYLGAKLKQTHLPNGVWAWGLSRGGNDKITKHILLPFWLFFTWDP